MSDSDKYRCKTCGVENERVGDARAHDEWCAGVEDFVQAVVDGEDIEPHMGTAHQFCEALNRVSGRYLDTDSSSNASNSEVANGE